MAVQTFPMRSTAIASLAFDDEKKWLDVTFNKGGTYRIENFPDDLLEQWMAAPSIGGFWNTNIKGRF
jgi:hypothetical protein